MEDTDVGLGISQRAFDCHDPLLISLSPALHQIISLRKLYSENYTSHQHQFHI